MTTTTDAGTQAMVALDRAIPGAHSALPERLSRWRLNLTRRFVIVAELLTAAVLVVLSPVIWWVALLIAVAVTALITVAYNGATAAGWGMRWARLLHYRRNAAARRRLLDRDLDDVADAGIAPLGAAEHLDAHDGLRARVVGHVEPRLHLDHRSSPTWTRCTMSAAGQSWAPGVGRCRCAVTVRRLACTPARGEAADYG